MQMLKINTKAVTLRGVGRSYKDAFAKPTVYYPATGNGNGRTSIEESCSIYTSLSERTLEPGLNVLVVNDQLVSMQRDILDYLLRDIISTDKTQDLRTEQVMSETEELRMLADAWYEETSIYSTMIQKSANDNYLKILSKGWKAVPFILKELEKRPRHWFRALAYITGENPVTDDIRGNLPVMTQAWLRLGKRKGWI